MQEKPVRYRAGLFCVILPVSAVLRVLLHRLHRYLKSELAERVKIHLGQPCGAVKLAAAQSPERIKRFLGLPAL